MYKYYVVIDTINFYNRNARVEVEDFLKAYVTTRFIPVRHQLFAIFCVFALTLVIAVKLVQFCCCRRKIKTE